jgi:hypothetical protein
MTSSSFEQGETQRRRQVTIQARDPSRPYI